mgnify:CR=1 FL=1
MPEKDVLRYGVKMESGSGKTMGMTFVVVWSYFNILSVFVKQKTAYELLRGLVGSEMCIRDRFSTPRIPRRRRWLRNRFLPQCS